MDRFKFIRSQRNNMRIIFLVITLILSSCGVRVSETNAATETPFVVTATLPSTLTPRPSETPLPPPPQPTAVPVEGTTSTQLNVRAEPSTASEVLGIIPANTRVEIVGRDPGENWWQILYPEGVDGRGWVTAQYVTTAGSPKVPVIGGAESESGSGASAIVIQQLNIRSGPGTSFNSLGILNADDVVTLTGRNSAGSWLQIEYPAGPDGRGWVNAGFVKASGVEVLPIVSDAGEVIGTGTPADTPLPPTPTVVPAPPDDDSAESPVKTVIFYRAGTNTLIYNGDVSTPVGDPEDWIAVTPYSEKILLEVSCSGSDVLVELMQSGQPLATISEIRCGSQLVVPVEPDQAVLVHVSVLADGLQSYSSYTLKVSTIQ